MPDPVKLTIDGRQIEAAPGTLLINAARAAGIEIPAFCYYDGYSLQAACRMCLVEVEKAPKMPTACTTPVAEGMVVRTDTEQVRRARKMTLEFLLTNHPLDCPVCDKGGECELQDMVFRYGAGESRFVENKWHVNEKQWSPVVFYDGPRCILCFRCVRVCNEGMGVGALGIVNRGSVSEIAPNDGDHLSCDECGMCIDICPVGALTSGIYRYQARPWEMEHVGTICTHCSNGCRTTLGVRNDHILRGNNRDKSGINGEFLCIKGRYAFDFYNHPERLQSPLMRVNGELVPVAWSAALEAVGRKFSEVKSAGGQFGVIGSTRTTNEENFYLQKFAREGLGTNNIDHHRSGDVVTLLDALSDRAGAGLATTGDLYNAKAILVIGADLSLEQPFLAFQVRANVRHHSAAVYTITGHAVREEKYSARSVLASGDAIWAALDDLREPLKAHNDLVVLFDDSIRGEGVRRLVEFCSALEKPVKYIALVDYANSRGAMDMGLVPELLPGYQPAPNRGLTLDQMLQADLDALWIIGANPLARASLPSRNTFVVVHEMFLTETARRADVIFPAASAYEKAGTFTNVCGEVQRLKKGLNVMGTKPDLEIVGLIAKEMQLAGVVGPWILDRVFEQVRRSVRGYDGINAPVIGAGGAMQTAPMNGRIPVETAAEVIRSAHNDLFASGSLGRYSKILNSVLENASGVAKPVHG